MPGVWHRILKFFDRRNYYAVKKCHKLIIFFFIFVCLKEELQDFSMVHLKKKDFNLSHLLQPNSQKRDFIKEIYFKPLKVRTQHFENCSSLILFAKLQKSQRKFQPVFMTCSQTLVAVNFNLNTVLQYTPIDKSLILL